MSILDISPDGAEFLLLQSDLNDETQRGTIWTMPVLGGAAKRLGNITARGASYSPDGKLIAFNEKESVYVCDTDGQNVKEIWNTHHMVPGNPAFSPDSKRLRVTVSRSILEDDLTRIWELNVDGRTHICFLFLSIGHRTPALITGSGRRAASILFLARTKMDPTIFTNIWSQGGTSSGASRMRCN